MKYKKSTSIFSIVIGIINVITWIMLIFTENVPELEAEFLSFILHWISEFGMAGFMILAGILIWKENRFERNVFFFGIGMMLIAILGALIYYIVFFDVFFVLMGITISSFGVIFLVMNFEKISDLFVVTVGFVLYAELNVIGNTLVNADSGSLLYTIIAMVPTVITATILIIKKIEF